MAQIKKDTSLRKAILQAAITGQLISDIGGESLPLAAAGKPSSATPSPRGYAPKTPNEFASFENQNSISERSERRTPKFLLSISIHISKICPLKRRASIIFLMLDLDSENPNAHYLYSPNFLIKSS